MLVLPTTFSSDSWEQYCNVNVIKITDPCIVFRHLHYAFMNKYISTFNYPISSLENESSSSSLSPHKHHFPNHFSYLLISSEIFYWYLNFFFKWDIHNIMQCSSWGLFSEVEQNNYFISFTYDISSNTAQYRAFPYFVIVLHRWFIFELFLTGNSCILFCVSMLLLLLSCIAATCRDLNQSARNFTDILYPFLATIPQFYTCIWFFFSCDN